MIWQKNKSKTKKNKQINSPKGMLMEKNKPRLILITGGVRSGKSSFAETLAGKLGKKITFIATAQALDKEMEDRIAQHRANRPVHWETYEEPYQVAQVIQKVGEKTEVILLDCLTLLVSNFMQDYQEDSSNNDLAEKIIGKIKEITSEAAQCPATVIIVSNEVGLGLVPANPMGRFFRDILGKANQIIASSSDEVYLMVAGISLLIKGKSDEAYL